MVCRAQSSCQREKLSPTETTFLSCLKNLVGIPALFSVTRWHHFKVFIAHLLASLPCPHWNDLKRLLQSRLRKWIRSTNLFYLTSLVRLTDHWQNSHSGGGTELLAERCSNGWPVRTQWAELKDPGAIVMCFRRGVNKDVLYVKYCIPFNSTAAGYSFHSFCQTFPPL